MRNKAVVKSLVQRAADLRPPIQKEYDERDERGKALPSPSNKTVNEERDRVETECEEQRKERWCANETGRFYRLRRKRCELYCKRALCQVQRRDFIKMK